MHSVLTTARARSLVTQRDSGPDFDRLALGGSITVGLIVGLFQAIGAVPNPPDAYLFWAADARQLYPIVWGLAGGYVYPPPLATFVDLVDPIGWPFFVIGWTTLCWFALWYCARSWVPVVVVASFIMVPVFGGNLVGLLFMGNVQIVLAAAVVGSIRGWAGWSVVPILTKLVGISLVWYAVRREWRNLSVAIGATAAVVATSFVLSPDPWFQFYTFITTNRIEQSPIALVPIALPVRLSAAIVLVAWGGLTDRRWTVPIAAGLAVPALYTWTFIPVWVGVIGISWRRTTPLLPWSRTKVVPATVQG